MRRAPSFTCICTIPIYVCTYVHIYVQHSCDPVLYVIYSDCHNKQNNRELIDNAASPIKVEIVGERVWLTRASADQESANIHIGGAII